MTKIGFYCKNNDESMYQVCLESSFKDPPVIEEIHSICKKFVIALGFTPKIVEDYFGKNDY